MSWWNPWATIAILKDNVANLQVLREVLEERIKKLEFTKKENEREIRLLEAELKETRSKLAEASKNDTRDTKGRFTKAKK
jgi:prefoldin subunit 5